MEDLDDFTVAEGSADLSEKTVLHTRGLHHGGNKLHHCPVDAIKLSAGKIMCCNGCAFGGRYPSVGCHGLMLGGDEFTVGAGRYSQDHYFTQSVGKRKIGELCLSLTDE